jgi:SAM-dependent methyltransferase
MAAMPSDADSAYRRFLQKSQSAESAKDIREGLHEWFDAALPAGEGKALDYGSGAGHAIDYLSARGFTHVEAYERNAAFAEGLKGKVAKLHDESDPAKFLDKTADTYDVIFCKDVFEHIGKEQVIGTAKQLRGALRDGGRLIVSVPHAVSFVGVYTRYDDFTHSLSFTESSLRYVLESAGFSSVQFHAPRFRFKLNPLTMLYRVFKWMWFLQLRMIYFLENPGCPTRPPHFHPRLVATAQK